MYYIEYYKATESHPWHLVNSHLVSDYCTRKLIQTIKKQGYSYCNVRKAYYLQTDFAEYCFKLHKQHIK